MTLRKETICTVYSTRQKLALHWEGTRSEVLPGRMHCTMGELTGEDWWICWCRLSRITVVMPIRIWSAEHVSNIHLGVDNMWGRWFDPVKTCSVVYMDIVIARINEWWVGAIFHDGDSCWNFYAKLIQWNIAAAYHRRVFLLLCMNNFKIS